jgi:hypothetical protein
MTHGRVSSTAPYQAALRPVAGISRKEAPAAEAQGGAPLPAPGGRYGTSGMSEEEVERIVAEFLRER